MTGPTTAGRSSAEVRPLAGRALAAVFAHPDDETFAMGAAFTRYSRAGVTCTLFTATDGDAGKSSSVAVASQQELGAVRRQELMAAAKHLGISRVDARGHPDKGLAALDAEALVAEIVAFLRRERPDVVVTFGPEGAPTAHPDHRAISRAATAAYFLAGMPREFPEHGAPHRPARLYYATYPPPPPMEGREWRLGLPPTVRLDARPFNAAKREGFLMHATQRVHQETFERVALTDDELYALAAGTPQPDDVADDLFDGL